MTSSGGESPPLCLSVVIPVRDGAGTIETAVASALDQSTRHVVEVVVAVAPSEDGTERVVADLAGDSRVAMVPNPRATTPSGLNAAIDASTGAVIVRCDAHARLPVGYLDEAVEVLEASGADVAGGRQVPVGRTLFERSVAHAMASWFGSGGATYRVGRSAGPAETVYLGVFRRATFAKVGLFDESLTRNQDYEFNHRVRASGGVVFYSPTLHVDYRPRGSVGRLARQYFDYGRWKRLMVRRYPASLKLRQLGPPLMVAAGVLSLAVATVRPMAGAAFPAAYGAAVLGAAAWRALRLSDPIALGLALTVPIMHVAWGVGFLVGGLRDPGPRIPSLNPSR